VKIINLTITVEKKGGTKMAAIDKQKTRYLEGQQTIKQMFDELREKVRQLTQNWNSNGLATAFQIEDLAGDWAGLVVQDIIDGQTTIQAFETWFDAGHDDNMEQIYVK
jgi:hypothetical protein